jgi:hypothetical protein
MRLHILHGNGGHMAFGEAKGLASREDFVGIPPVCKCSCS